MFSRLLLKPFEVLFRRLFGLQELKIPVAVLIAYMAGLACVAGRTYLYVGYVILMIATMVAIRRDYVYISNTVAVLMLFSAYCFASALWAEDVGLVFEQAIFILVGVIFTFVISNYCIQKKSFDGILIAIVISGVALSIYSVIQYNGLSEIVKLAEQGERVGQDINNVNTIGMTCSFSVVVLFYYIFYRKKYLASLLMVFPIIVSIATGSRKAIIILVLGFLLTIILKPGRGKDVVRYFKVMLLLIIAFILLQYLSKMEFMSNINERMDNLIELITQGSTKHEGSANMRLKMIEVGWKAFKENPVLGMGLNNAKIVAKRELNFDAYLHNDYIEQLVNGGIIGFLLYYGVIARLLISHIELAIRFPKNSIIRISLMIIIIFLISNVGAVTYYQSLTTYLYIALWITVIELTKRNEI